MLAAALGGGYYRNGSTKKPEKNDASHYVDAGGYGLIGGGEDLMVLTFAKKQGRSVSQVQFGLGVEDRANYQLQRMMEEHEAAARRQRGVSQTTADWDWSK